ncbi:3-oxoacyl-(acyl-carrier-protein) synthase III [Thermanaerovibrio velox DSM 12556]|uniref:Beta-ketoacyl-[acyl-carrier-protein] synthase III n=1 Tax=Thermanaerovibrio velox DSM 12556 TaxID=926567 RepID=H0US30_9BACT|nr:beta-ketoacyl-ACP synthase III [Thermanaerovibrio velox]EHM10119.1 3-oxoacyl-(acyl-carrier-protein) synthase III [Thermanaerovibrio velox DSM 12556]
MPKLGGLGVAVLGSGMAVPGKVVTNQDLEKMVDTSDQWIVERTGIRTRFVAEEGVLTSDISEEASRMALERAGISPEDLDLILVGTNSPDTLFPSVAAKLQGRLGAVKAGAADVQSGCTGSLYALAMGASFVASGVFKYILVVGAEVLSRLVDWNDRNTCVLFGDGAGAVVLGPARDEGLSGRVLGFSLKADGAKHDLITLMGGLVEHPASHETVDQGLHWVKMKGNDVFKFVNREIPPFLDGFLGEMGFAPGDVSSWVFHQANWRIMEGVLRRLGVPEERAVVNLDKYGNTSCASIMMALHEAIVSGRIRKGDKVVISSFGAGMTYGAMLMEF